MNANAVNLQSYVGRQTENHDVVDAHRLRGMIATLDRDDPTPVAGTSLPPCWHWMFCQEAAPHSVLGEDGHPDKGEFLPPIALPRRMWAGSRIVFFDPPVVGDTVIRRSTILSVTPKSGKSGDLVFVVVCHETCVGDRVAVQEEQDLVYREAPQPHAPALSKKPAPASAAWSRPIVPDPVLLFRYSALTFNGHRIHYDQPYCVNEEGYPGLVVHGPLIATLMLDLCRRHRPEGRISEFSFRAMSPLFDTQSFSVSGEPDADGPVVKVWAADASGGLASQGTVTFD